MATQNRLTLTRDQLAAFLKDHNSIRQFERLFGVVDLLPEDILTLTLLAEGAELTAGDASATAVQALDTAQLLLSTLDTPRPETPPQRTRRGAFQRVATQTAALPNVAYPIVFDATVLSSGVYLGTPLSRVIVDTPGTYTFDAAVQLDRTAAGVSFVWLWARLNGTDVANSAVQHRVNATDGETSLRTAVQLALAAGDYVEFAWETDAVTTQLQTLASTAVHPAGAAATLLVSPA